MEVVVCIKQVVDLKQVRIKRDTREPVLEGLPLVLSDIDKNALEEAVRLKERLGEAKVTALSLGSGKLRETIKEALAIGADEAILVTDPALQGGDPSITARALAAAVGKLGHVDLVLLGEGSADNYTGQVGPRLAELLSLPQVTFVKQMDVVGGTLRATRSLEDGLEVVEVPLPALVTVVAEINEPRLPTLPQILRAGRKPIQEWSAADLGLIPGPPAVTQRSNLAPQQERKNVIFTGDVDQAVGKLVDALVREGVWQ
ncbi:MAG: electron transfer flavoprotein subunit beta/FixA family protein [Chloroflexota bacterium]